MKTRWDAGQFKLRGKKHMHLSCRCCTISDYRQECLEKESKEEILLAMIHYKLEKQISLDSVHAAWRIENHFGVENE